MMSARPDFLAFIIHHSSFILSEKLPQKEKENNCGDHRSSHQAHGRQQRTVAGLLLDHV
jgi:hypothetical protein